ncbi:MAG: hypothetical protein V4689_12845 [Verrucomicrobiota bacterium]
MRIQKIDYSANPPIAGDVAGSIGMTVFGSATFGSGKITSLRQASFT